LILEFTATISAAKCERPKQQAHLEISRRHLTDQAKDWVTLL
jgi:hypothetical protein